MSMIGENYKTSPMNITLKVPPKYGKRLDLIFCRFKWIKQNETYNWYFVNNHDELNIVPYVYD
jgi:hypothetical protein